MKILNSNPVTYNKQTFKMKKRKIPSFYKEKAYKNKRNVMGRKGIHVINKKRKMVIYNIKKEIYCNSHVLDYAINDALNRYNTCMENLKNGTIRSFKLRSIKYTKPIKIVKFEKYCAKKDGFAISALGKMYSEIPKFDYDKNTRTITIIQYNSKTNDFFMLIKYKKKDKSNRPPYSEKENIGSIDPGIRSMLTVYANNKIEEIGTNCKQKIKRQLKRIDRINNNEMIDEKKRQKITNKKYEKIKNQVNDMHWKIAHYLTDNYKTIVIGNFSTRNMGKKIPKMIKRIGGMLSFFKFREKLKYLCKYKNTEYIKIDEAYTSKCCSECGNYKKDLGANKIYNCKECKMKIDRDINGAKNILMLSL
jgi:IS605 OrfB family transposase